jgi:hypothetical protein
LSGKFPSYEYIERKKKNNREEQRKTRRGREKKM